MDGLITKNGEVGKLWGKGSGGQETAPGQGSGLEMFLKYYFLSPHANPEPGHAGCKEEQISARPCASHRKNSGGGLPGRGGAAAGQ